MIDETQGPEKMEGEASAPSVAKVSPYHAVTGRILGVWTMPASLLGIQHDPFYPEEADGTTHYIDVSTGQLLERPPLDLQVSKTELVADGEDFVTVTGVPVGCSVVTPAGHFIVEDGVVEFATVRRGTHRLFFDAFPEQQGEVIVHAH
ncbi:hypothetical protein [Azospirillum brasilense]|uniref:hypothetical protein n=1 Tax=Azospirillum brasilense TaxID=192 RepID=UPI000E689BFC|nr:hypothetical protein [Azospirillum brasilense]NUB28220.1 hypothetical protein [Azospirillum brasilense]NUB33738.1 hypothetical protein [Azospirillum brasilense]RIW04441.1 hypothetical protein D2T81_10795 [Azospirillum brasilense]